MSYLDEFAGKLNLPKARKEQVLREVSSHYHEIRDELIAGGMDPGEADREAGRRLGNPAKIASQLMSVHCHAEPWWSAIIAALLVPLAAILVRSEMKLVVFGLCGGRGYGPVDSPWGYSEHLVVGAIVLIAVILLTLSILGIRRGSRPIWLIPCLVSGLLLLTRLPDDIAMKSPGFEWFANDMSANVANSTLHAMGLRIGAAILAIAVVAAYWRSRRLISVLLPVLAVCILTSAYPYPGWSVVLFTVVMFAGWILLGVRLFGHPRASNGAYVYMFLFTYFVIGYWGTGMGITEFDFTRGVEYTIPYYQPHLIIAATAVLAFARASTWQAKALVPLAGTLASTMVGIMPAGTGAFHWPVDHDLAVRTLQLLTLLVVGIVYWSRARVRRPQTVR